MESNHDFCLQDFIFKPSNSNQNAISCPMINIVICIFQKVIEGLQKKGHETEITSTAGSIVQAIVVNPDGSLDAACDSRKGGIPDGF